MIIKKVLETCFSFVSIERHDLIASEAEPLQNISENWDENDRGLF
jgi:hypothetical protein